MRQVCAANGDCTYDCKDPVNPSPSNMVSDETHNKSTPWNSQSYHERPNTHVSSTLVLEEGFSDNGRSNRGSRRNEKRHQSSARSHGTISRGNGASYIANPSAECGKKPQRTATPSLRQRLPEQRRSSENGNLERGKVGSLWYSDMELCGDVLVCRDNGSGVEGGHGGMERNEDEVYDFL